MPISGVELAVTACSIGVIISEVLGLAVIHFFQHTLFVKYQWVSMTYEELYVVPECLPRIGMIPGIFIKVQSLFISASISHSP